MSKEKDPDEHLNNVTTPANLRVRNKVEVELGDKKYELRYPASAFVKFQEKYKGWRTAWGLLKYDEGDLNYDVLTDFLHIGINREEMTYDVVRALVMELYQDEVAEIIVNITKGSVRWLPKEVKKEGEENPTT